MQVSDVGEQLVEQDDVVECDTHAAARQGVAHVDGVAHADDARLDDRDRRQPTVGHRADTIDLERRQERPSDVF